MHPALAKTAHRPWPLPSGRWQWRQTWGDLLFAHWPVSVDLLRPLVPPSLEVQEFGGTSWVGVVPFQMSGVMKRPLPDLPYFSSFPELNLRLYVEHQGRPGVWFLSLDASNAFAVWAARRFFHLPYHHARISLSRTPEEFTFSSGRRRSTDEARFAARYRPVGSVRTMPEGSLENWLTERYCLYAESPKGALYRTEVHHDQWQLHSAEAAIQINRLTDPFGFQLEGEPALVHFSNNIDVIIWSPEKVIK